MTDTKITPVIAPDTHSPTPILDTARTALAQAVAVDEVVNIRDNAEAMRVRARLAKDKQMELDAAEIRLRSERKLGEMMRAQREAGLMAKPPGANQHRGKKSPDARPALAEVGVNKDLAKRAREAAAPDNDEFENVIDDWRADAVAEPDKVVKLPKPKKRPVAGTKQPPPPPDRAKFMRQMHEMKTRLDRLATQAPSDLATPQRVILRDILTSIEESAQALRVHTVTKLKEIK